jgi:hypothetical protein
MLQPSPRHFMPSAALPGAGLPGDRMARLAARKAFVELKLTFIEAVEAPLAGTRRRLAAPAGAPRRGAGRPVAAARPAVRRLSGSEPERRLARLRLRRSLDSLFPDTGAATGNAAFCSAFGTF